MISNIIPCTTLLYWIAAVVLSGAISLLMVLRLYVFYTLGICKSKNRMDGKTVIITGCTSGIGKETARDLAKRGARIIMACRNTDIANQLKSFVIKITILITLLNGSRWKWGNYSSYLLIFFENHHCYKNFFWLFFQKVM